MILASLRAVRPLLLAIFLLMAGAGSITTIISFRLEASGNPAIVVGTVATAYFVGLIAGAAQVVSVIARVGHIRTFSAVVSMLSVTTLLYSITQHVLLWSVLRFIDGLCVASVFVCLESWLNDRAAPTMRGSVLAAYMTSLYAGQAAGQMLLDLRGTPGLPLVVASVLTSLAVLPIALTRSESPRISSQQTAFSIRALYVVSPLGFVGVFVTGLMIGAFYALGVVYAGRIGFGRSDAALFMGLAILGGVALQWPLGWLSDRHDRRVVIAGVLLAATTISASLIFGETFNRMAVLGLVVAFGGLLFALYPLCAAHTNDHLSEHERVAAGGKLILVYSGGAAIGPVAGSLTMQALGSAGLFWWTGVCAGIALVFACWRQIRRKPIPVEDQRPYQPLPRTTPMAAYLEQPPSS